MKITLDAIIPFGLVIGGIVLLSYATNIQTALGVHFLMAGWANYTVNSLKTEK